MTSPDAEVTVLIVDDQLPFRLAARAVVGRTPGFELVGEAVAHAAGGTAPYAPRPWAVARVGPRGADLRVAHCDRVSGCEVRPFVFHS